MADVARVTTVTAASQNSFKDAVDEGLSKASDSLRNITGLEVVEQKAKVTDGSIQEYRVKLEITFILD